MMVIITISINTNYNVILILTQIALIKEMDKLSRVKLDNHPSFNDDANSKKW